MGLLMLLCNMIIVILTDLCPELDQSSWFKYCINLKLHN